LKIGFHYHVPAAGREGAIYMPGYQGRFVEAVAAHCSKVVCFLHSPREDERQYLDHRISSPNIEWVNIGPHTSTPNRMLNARRFTAPARARRADIDLMLLRGPSPLLPQMASAVQPVPRALLLVGSYVDGVEDLPQPRWRKKLIQLWSHWNDQAQTKVAAKALTFVNSRKLYEAHKGKAPALYETRTTTLNEKDFFQRDDTCQRKPIRLLYTGRMDRSKGLLEIVEALSNLVKEGHDLGLDLVGWPEKGDPILAEIRDYAQSQGIGNRVAYHGFKAVGPELFECYRAADIFVVASSASEGFPRTIWEAMAHSVPVLATEVGSIPHFIKGAAKLIPPRNLQALISAIRELIGCSDERRAYIRAGRASAMNITLEKQVKEMFGTMETWLRQNRHARAA
jgi:glycosyltransferase involved in cell wall biosynthesis